MKRSYRWMLISIVITVVFFIMLETFFVNPFLRKQPTNLILPQMPLVIPTIPVPLYKAPGVDCPALFQENKDAINDALAWHEDHPAKATPDSKFAQISDCPTFLHDRAYIVAAQSEEELNFPLAFSMMVFRDVAQFERLLRAVYRPQNYYCVHVDAKAPSEVFRGVARLVECLSLWKNIVLAPRRVSVVWGHYSVLEADLVCFRELFWKFARWRYLINLTGQEFPLRTNLELVRILKTFNGANSVEGTYKRRNVQREPRKSPGFEVRWMKGSVHVTASRGFIQFLLTDKRALTLLTLLKHSQVPDEQYFATLNHNPQLGAPGAYLGTPETDPVVYPFITRLKNWGDFPFNYPCKSGHWVRQICIWGVRDLPFINNRPELFVNKFYWDFQPATLNCMEERYFNHTRRDYAPANSALGKAERIDLDFYRNLDFVKHHLPS